VSQVEPQRNPPVCKIWCRFVTFRLTRRPTQCNVARFTIIYRVSRSLIRSRSQATPAFMMPESCRGDVMRDLRADWRRWTRGERVAAVFIAIGMTSLTPALLLLGGG
jgi:hypothetical protein